MFVILYIIYHLRTKKKPHISLKRHRKMPYTIISQKKEAFNGTDLACLLLLVRLHLSTYAFYRASTEATAREYLHVQKHSIAYRNESHCTSLASDDVHGQSSSSYLLDCGMNLMSSAASTLVEQCGHVRLFSSH